MSRAAVTKSAAAARPRTRPELFQDMLVYQDDSQASTNALSYADALATAADGNLSAVMFGFLAVYPTSIYMEATPDVWLAAQRKADEEAAIVEGKVRARLKDLRSAPELRRESAMGGEAGQLLAMQARYADATVLGINEGGPDALQRQLFEASLFYSGRPVIVVPATFERHQQPRKIMVAWRPGREATRALHDALPLLKAADDVKLVVVDEYTSVLQEKEPGVDIARHLARHDIEVEAKHVPGGGGTIAATLLNEARYFGADLIVMGGYGHSRMREWILGGATRDILRDTHVPVLMAQ